MLLFVNYLIILVDLRTSSLIPGARLSYSLGKT